MKAKLTQLKKLRRASVLVVGAAVMALTFAAPSPASAMKVVNWGGCSSCPR